ncbi:hypothetical protein PENSOL_c001G03559 [Penicillium solitum]|uniref:Uncharacterized protein n=1 Tax=Penicillium solitum TaxID=60172 RepID=A0A1V6RQM0_9EURO|nr:uncharacterized protein PENSOL_c001G03559 [Penicillium solitum]OQE03850.1 hypothetical protein PENSOL_c001G03559 [Penicillium solitum]
MPSATDDPEIGSITQSPTQSDQNTRFDNNERKSEEQNEEPKAALHVPERGQTVSSSHELLFPFPKPEQSNEGRANCDLTLLPRALRIRQPETSSTTSSRCWDGIPTLEGPAFAESRASATVFNEYCGSEGHIRNPDPSSEKLKVVKGFFELMEEIWVSSVGDDTFHDPLSNHLKPIFQSFKQKSEQAAIVTLSEWLRVAEWWALKGATGLKKIPDSHMPASAQPSQDMMDALLQVACDLKKAQWICYEILPSHAETAQLRNLDRDRIDTVHIAAFELYSDIARRYRSIAVLMSTLETIMTRIERDKIGQITNGRFDLRLFLPYPSLSQKHESGVYIPTGSSSTAWLGGPGIGGLPPIITSDIELAFHYNNSFLETRLWTNEHPDPSPSFACILSIVRERDSSQSKWILASQTQLVQVVIHSHGNDVITWQDVQWDLDQKCMWICIAGGVRLSAEFDQESEFRRHWSVASHISEFVSRISPRVDERVLFDNEVNLAHYRNYSIPGDFPTGPVERCVVRLFEQQAINAEGQQRTETVIFRMVLATPNSSKFTSSVSFVLDPDSPVVYSVHDSGEGLPSIMVDLSNNEQTCTVSLSFDTPEDRDYLQSCFMGLSSHHPETRRFNFTVQSFSVLDPKGAGGEAGSSKRLGFGGGSTTVIGPQLGPSLNHDQARKSEALRIVNLTAQGSFADRIVGDLEDLKIGLDVMKTNSVQIFRTEQPSVLTAVASDQASQGARDIMKKLGKLMSNGPSVQLIEFYCKQDLHAFIESIFGYGVTFDGD